MRIESIFYSEEIWKRTDIVDESTVNILPSIPGTFSASGDREGRQEH